MNIERENVVVVIPVYKTELSETESLSLRQCVRLLSDYQIVIVMPEGLDIESLLKEYHLNMTETFDRQFFESVRSYNKLILNENFYGRFSHYTYMLIYQLDAYVFKDELLQWCREGYDYIGAPWLPYKDYMDKPFRRWFFQVRFHALRLFNPQELKKNSFNPDIIGNGYFISFQVGNGGFSLRKISKFIKITHRFKKRISLLLDDKKPFYPEDLLLQLEFKGWNALKKPNWKKALRFSVEARPDWALRYFKGQLPFGTHAWNLPVYNEPWKNYIK